MTRDAAQARLAALAEAIGATVSAITVGPVTGPGSRSLYRGWVRASATVHTADSLIARRWSAEAPSEAEALAGIVSDAEHALRARAVETRRRAESHRTAARYEEQRAAAADALAAAIDAVLAGGAS